MPQTDAATVRKQIVVEAPIERAFAAFTERLGAFKPPEHNLLGVPEVRTVFEPRVGGRITDRPGGVPAGRRSPTASTLRRAGRPLYLERYAALFS